MTRPTARSLSALALVAAPAVTTVALAIDVSPQADTTEELLLLVSGNAQRWSTGLTLFLLSGPLWVPAGIALLRLFGRGRALGWWAAVAVLVGGVAIVPVDTSNVYLSGLATSGIPLAEQVAIADGVNSAPTLLAIELLHGVGFAGGLLVVAIALFRSRIVPPWAAAGIVVGLVGLLAAPQQLVHVLAMGLVTVVLAVVAARVARMTDDEWQRGAAEPQARVTADV